MSARNRAKGKEWERQCAMYWREGIGLCLGGVYRCLDEELVGSADRYIQDRGAVKSGPDVDFGGLFGAECKWVGKLNVEAILSKAVGEAHAMAQSFGPRMPVVIVKKATNKRSAGKKHAVLELEDFFFIACTMAADPAMREKLQIYIKEKYGAAQGGTEGQAARSDEADQVLEGQSGRVPPIQQRRHQSSTEGVGE